MSVGDVVFASEVDDGAGSGTGDSAADAQTIET